MVKFNHLLVIQKYGVVEAKHQHLYPSVEIPLTHENDLNRVNELRRTRRKQSKHQINGKRAGLGIGCVIIAGILLFPALVVSIILGQYNPAPVFTLEVGNNRNEKLDFNTKYSALSYNTGFAAYNQNMHFYMDSPGQMIWGGQGTAESRESVDASLAGFRRIIADHAHDTNIIIDSNDEEAKTNELRGSRIYSTEYTEATAPDGSTYYPRKLISDEFVSDINTFDANLNAAGDGLFDFVALQEQDINCNKSCQTNQPQIINDTPVWMNNTEYKFSDIYNSTFALNFSTPFIPLPLNDIFGKAVAGLSTFSRYYNASSQRVALANITTFPLNLFELKRCLSMNWYPIGNAEDPRDQKYFVFINAHLAAYDSGGNIRIEQLTQLNQIMEDLDQQGDYYMIAADWNQIIPDTRGYEGHDALNSEKDYADDDPIMAWDFIEFNSEIGNQANPDLNKDYIFPTKYDPEEYYEKDALVSYEYTGSATFDDLEPVKTAWYTGNNGSLTQYMASTKRHNYQAVVENPTEAPVNAIGEKSSQWIYSLSNDAVYKDASMNDMVRDTLLPMAYSDRETSGIKGVNHYYAANANFYKTHAIPTLRNAGEQFRNESIAAEGYCYKASIDGFLVSKNIKVFMTYGFDTNFKYSDHNPVAISFEFVR